MQNHSLTKLVRMYQRKQQPQLDKYLAYFQRLPSVEQAIKFACLGKDEKIHSHQFRVGKQKLEEAKKKLLSKVDRIEACQSFDELLGCVDEHTRGIDRFGVLAVYDTSLRMGAYLGLWPEVVYLHAGTKQGCKALNVGTSGRTLEMHLLPKPVRILEPYHAENFLCIFKGHFRGVGGEVDGCLPAVSC